MTHIFLAAQAQGDGGMSMLLMLVAIIAISWFFMIRPQQKKQKEIQMFQNSLTEGSKIITGGGIHGTVKRINQVDNTVDVQIASGVVVTVEKAYIFKDAANVPMGK